MKKLSQILFIFLLTISYSYADEKIIGQFVPITPEIDHETIQKVDNCDKANITIDDPSMSMFDEFKEDCQEVSSEKCPTIEPYNRWMTKTNDKFYVHIMQPVSDGYVSITHENFRDGVSNFFYNLAFPLRFINNVLQFKLLDATEEAAIFVVNTTVGILGIFQPAQNYFNLENHKEDFGQTLGVYGFGSGCHVVLPFFGPSNVRDIVGLAAGTQVDPLNSKYEIANGDYETLGYKVYDKLNNSDKTLDQYNNLKSNAIDLYPYLRDSYEQYRKKQIEE